MYILLGKACEEPNLAVQAMIKLLLQSGNVCVESFKFEELPQCVLQTLL